MREKLWLGLVTVFAYLTDQTVKAAVLQSIPDGGTYAVIKNIFHLTPVYNTGVAFSMFENQPERVLWLTGFLFLGFLSYALLRPNPTRWDSVLFGLILGGALGNIHDRATIGKVVDYLDFQVFHYPIFNLADTFIFCGVLLLAFRYFKSEPKHPDAPGQ